jgi:DNA polymerase-3 subunit delta
MVRVFAGKNFYLLRQHVSKIKNDFADKNGDMSIEEIDCEDIKLTTLAGALRSIPLFSEKKLVIAKNIAQNKKLSEQVEQVFTTAENANDLIIVESNIDKRGTYYKFLKKNSDFTQCDEPDENLLVNWLLKEAQSLGANLSKPDALYLTNRIGLNQQLLYNELSKLAAYESNITRGNINNLTSERPVSSIFNLLDAAFAGNSEASLRIYEEQKSQGSAPQSIFGMIIWQANIIATVAAGSSISPGELSAATGIKPFSLNKANSIYKKIGRKGVNTLLDRLVHADRQMKTRSADPDELLKNLLVTIS